MQCNFPKWLEFHQMFVPCGKCVGCKIARTREWTIRLLHENEDWEHSLFITLTYDDEHLPIGETLVKKDLQLFWKNLRSNLSYPIKHFSVGEYGDTFNRPHYHSIVYGLGPWDETLIEKCWNKGLIHVGTVTSDSIQYVSGYIQKKLSLRYNYERYGDRIPPFQLQSKGIGLNWAEKNADIIVRDLEIRYKNVPVGIPRYYKKKLEIPTEKLLAKSEEYRKCLETTLDKRGVVSFNMLKEQQKRSVQRERNLKAKAKIEDRKHPQNKRTEGI